MSHPEDPGRVPDPFRLDPPPDLFALPVPPVEPTLSFDLDPPPALPEPSLLGGQTIDNARFKARGWISPYFSAQAGDESITIRVDDLARPELWCELILPGEVVAELLARIIAMRPNVEQGTYQLLRALGKDY